MQDEIIIQVDKHTEMLDDQLVIWYCAFVIRQDDMYPDCLWYAIGFSSYESAERAARQAILAMFDMERRKCE